MKKWTRIFDFSIDNDRDVFISIISYISALSGAKKCVEVSIVEKTRSNQQNRALHLYWKQLSDALNSEGQTYISRRGKDLKFTAFKIESDWREAMQEMYGIYSTTDLTTEMINEIYDCINLDYSLQYGIHVDFPNWQSFLNKMEKL